MNSNGFSLPLKIAFCKKFLNTRRFTIALHNLQLCSSTWLLVPRSSFSGTNRPARREVLH